MGSLGPWLALAASVLIIGGYELRLWRAARKDPRATARSAHRVLRAQWVSALSRHPGSELLAVQALRNSLMSATITASTAALALMGAISLTASKADGEGPWLHLHPLSPRLVLELGLMSTLFAAYVCSAMAARYYHHTGYLMSLPVGSAEREEGVPTAILYVQRAGVLYSWSLRCFLLLAPIVIGMLSPLLMPPGALAFVLVLRLFDGTPKQPGG